MALKVQSWKEADFRKNLTRRLAYAKAYRKKLEDQWQENESCYYGSAASVGNGVSPTLEDPAGAINDEDMNASTRDVAINYVSRDIRYMHAVMSSNPPTVKIIPTSTDMEDEERADAADIAARWAGEHYTVAEVVDQRNLKMLTKGTGYLRFPWDTTLGKVLAFDEGTGELTMSGDTRFYSPSTWDIWLDPDAKCSDTRSVMGPRWFFEQIDMTLEEAVMRFPEHVEDLKKSSGKPKDSSRWRFWEGGAKNDSQADERIQIFFYAERGEAVNGMLGRQAYMLEGGAILDHGANEHPNAELGLDVLTDIDVEDEPYGKSLIEYLSAVQMMIQSLDANTMRNIAAHGGIRLYVDSETTLDDDSLSDDSFDIIRGTGKEPKFLASPSQMPDSWKLRDQLYQGSRDVSMINEAMLGQASRETSGFTTQIQVNQGNMGRRRLFNKYKGSTKNVFYNLLALMIENWSEPRKIQVLGTERSYEVHSFSSTDLDGGWDILAEYGQNFSLDPNTARDQVMQLVPLLEKIPDFNWRSLAEVVRLNVMDNFVDQLTVAKRRQRKIFKEMIRAQESSGDQAFIAPRELENHKDMLAYCKEFVMTTEYDLLENDTKEMCDRHIKARQQMLADEIVKAQGPAPGAPPPGAGMPPPPGPPLQMPGLAAV